MSKCDLALKLPPRAVAFNKKGDVLAVACDGPGGKACLVLYEHVFIEGLLEALCMSLHPRLGACSRLAVLDGNADILLHAFNLSQKRRLTERARVEADAGKMLSIAFSPDDRCLVSGGEDGAIIVWDLVDEVNDAFRMNEHTERVTCVAYNPSGTCVASSSCDFSVRLWDPRTGVCMGVLLGHEEIVSCVCFSPDGLVLASAGRDPQSVRLWGVKSGDQKEIVFKGLPKSSARSVDFSPNGELIAVGCRDWTVRLFATDTGLPATQSVMSSHWGIVSCVKFSPEGDLLASGSDDGTVRIWNTLSGEQVGQALQHMACVNGVAFCMGSSDLATVSGDLWTPDRGVHIWNGKLSNIVKARRADYAVSDPAKQQRRATTVKVKALRRMQKACGAGVVMEEEEEDDAEKEKKLLIDDLAAYRRWLELTGRVQDLE